MWVLYSSTGPEGVWLHSTDSTVRPSASTGRLRSYLVAMAERIEHIADDDERSAAIKWLEWCDHYATERDPLNKPIKTPTVRSPGYSDIAQFRKRLGFAARFW